MAQKEYNWYKEVYKFNEGFYISLDHKDKSHMLSHSLQQAHKDALSELGRYKLLVENVQDYAIFFMDKEGYIQTWNKGAQKAKGYRADEIIGKHFSIFYTPEDILDNKPERMLDIAKKVGRVEDEDWRVKKDGSKFWANVVITALKDEDGDLQGFAKVTRNLTERKQYEDELRDANILLKTQQAELQKLNESKDEFISLASHQLRTPATAIKQLLGMLLEGFEGPLPEHLQNIIQKTYESNERQIMIVNNLLRVAQIDAGKIKLRREICNINNIIDSLFKEHEGVVRDRNQTLIYEIPNESILGYIDGSYYRMALENILDNASKYTQNGGRITVKASRRQNYACVSIKDTGIGISSEDIPSLFEKFYRVSNDVSHHVAGSGLGLYWSKKVIELHGGKIELDSELGKGTCFKVLVPAEDSHA